MIDDTKNRIAPEVKERIAELPDDYLHCPRCNDESEIMREPNRVWIRCMAVECGIESGYFFNEGEAKEWWQKTFQSHSQLQEENEKMLKALKLADEVIGSLYPVIRRRGVSVIWPDFDRQRTRCLIGEYDQAKDAALADKEK